RDVYIHGLIRDPLGQKMSKSKGNVIDPLGLLDTYGTDALRFALAAFVGMGRDIKLAPERIEGYRNFANKLWNAARFVLMNVEGAGSAAPAVADTLSRGERPPDAALPDRWILSRLERATAEVRDALDAYRFNDAAVRLYQFTWNEFCDWYVEAAKIPLGAGCAAAERTRGVLLHVLERLLRLLHPTMPFISEEIWQAVVAEGWGAARAARFPQSIMVAEYPRPLGTLLDDAAEAEMGRLMALVRAVRNLRSELSLPPSRRLAAEVFAADAGARRLLEAASQLITTLARGARPEPRAAARHGGLNGRPRDRSLLGPPAHRGAHRPGARGGRRPRRHDIGRARAGRHESPRHPVRKATPRGLRLAAPPPRLW